MLGNAIPQSQPNKAVVFYRLRVNGRELSTTIGLVALSINRIFNKVALAQIVLTDGDAHKHDFELSNSNQFQYGNELDILMGYENSNSLEVVFKGIITKQSVLAPEKGQSRLIVEAKDKAVKLTLARKTQFFENSTDKTIIQEIANQFGLTSEVGETPFQHPEMVQYDATAWDFIVMRAEANGLMVATDNGILKLIKPEIATTPQYKARFGYNLFELEAEIDGRRQVKKVVAKSWDYTKQEVSQEEGQSQFTEGGNHSSSELAQKFQTEETYYHSGHLKAQQLTAWSNAHALRSRLSKICGRVRIKGESSLKLGQTIEIDGAGAQYNGLAYITGIAHHYDKGWETEVQFGWSEEWFYQQIVSERPATTGLLPDAAGLQIGVVLEEGDDNDPDYKVKVKMPLLDPTGKGIWARLTTFEAGNGRGTYFRPKVGDEVILGFLSNDPRFPVILGSVYSRNHAPGVASKPTEQKYGYKSAQAQQLIFDDSAKTIKLETGSCSIILNGQNNTIELKVGGNTIKIDNTSIKVEASAEVTVKGGTIKLN
jgi:Rhs element Vgr protein